MKILFAVCFLLSAFAGVAGADENVSLDLGFSVTRCVEGTDCYIAAPRATVQITLLPKADGGIAYLEGSYETVIQKDGHTFKGITTVAKLPTANGDVYVVMGSLEALRDADPRSEIKDTLGLVVLEDLAKLNGVMLTRNTFKEGEVSYDVVLAFDPPGSARKLPVLPLNISAASRD